MQQQKVAAVARAGVDADVLDRDVAAVHQLVAVVVRRELIQPHPRPVDAEPDEIPVRHAPGSPTGSKCATSRAARAWSRAGSG